MKLNVSFLLVLCVWLSFSSCGEEETNTPPFLNIEHKALDFNTPAASIEISVQSNLQSLESTVREDGKAWCSANILNGSSSKLKIDILENTDLGVRETEIVVKAGSLSETIKIRQLGKEAAILVNPGTFSLTSISETIHFTVTANTAFTIQTPDWIQEALGTRSSEMAETSHTYLVEANKSDQKRIDTIRVRATGVEKEALIIVTQKGMNEYENDHGDDIKDDIKLSVKSAEASSFQPGEEIEKSIDGNKESLYHSSWSNSGGNYFPITLTYRFENQESLDYFVYHPRTSGSNGLFKETEIWISTEEYSLRKVMEKDFKGSPYPTKILFDQPILKPTAVQIIVKSGTGDGQGFASCSEMEFYRKNPDNFDPLTLFSDATCSELKPGITETEINACEYPLYRTIALFLLEDKYPSEFRIQEYKAYPHPDMQAEVNKTGPYSLLDNPTGIVAEEGKELIIFVGDTYGETIGLKIQNLDQPGGDGYWNGSSSYSLSEGINKITPTNKGLVYVLYHTNRFETAPAVKIHIASGSINGYFDVSKHDASQWKSLLDNVSYKYFDVVGEYAHLTFPTQRFRNNTPDGKALIDVYDKIVSLEQEFMGLRKYNRMFSNRMYLQVMYTSYMYATSYYTSYNDETLNELCNVQALRTNAIWGPAHEIGHVNQTRPGMKWLGTTEVTNNIHSQYVQTTFGNASRLQSESTPPYLNRYEKAMTEFFPTGIAHCQHGDVFCKLVPFWQLQLYFSNVKGSEDFYKDLYEVVRISPNKETAGEQQLDFVRMVCNVAQTNLWNFFERWGFLTPVDIEIDDYGIGKFTITTEQIASLKKEIEQKNYPVSTVPFWYITDNTVNVFKQAYKEGVALKNGNTFTMTGWEGVAGYEVYTNGELVFATASNKFTLVNTTANATTAVFAVKANGEKTKIRF